MGGVIFGVALLLMAGVVGVILTYAFLGFIMTHWENG